MSAEDLAKQYERKYGHRAAATGRFNHPTNVDSTGILALDYALGTGGWPDGTIIECFGPPDIGKSSIIGFNAVKEAQANGKMCGWVALEPGFDPAWAEKNGIDLDRLLIVWPNDGKEAFDMLFDMVQEPEIKTIVFDSIGAILRPSEAEVDGKPSQGGQSALITWGIKRIAPPTWKNDKTVILLNQIRDDMNARIPGLVESPGGHALKHAAEIRVQLKPGKERYTLKVHGEDVIIGRQIVALIKRSKKDEGSGKRAIFDHYSMETEDAPFGIDRAADVVNTGKRTGVITSGGAWLYHEAFPDGKLQGKKAVAEYIEANPNIYSVLRDDILTVMSKKNAKTPLKAVNKNA